MIIKLSDYEVSELKNIFIKKIQDEGIDIEKKSEDEWEIKSRNILIYRGIKFFEFLKTEWSNTSIKPLFTIVDKSKNEITIIHSRSQDGKGSTDQKLPYGNFIVEDYVSRYEEIKNNDYDLKVAFVLNEFFDDDRYKPLLKYLRSNSIYTWINKVKI